MTALLGGCINFFDTIFKFRVDNGGKILKISYPEFSSKYLTHP